MHLQVRIIAALCLFLSGACVEPGQTEIARGNVLASQRKFEEALAAYRRAADAAPHKARPRELLGHLLLDLGRSADARAAYTAALQLEPGNALEAQIGLARLDTEEGRSDEALAQLNEVLRQHPDNLYALLSRANVEMRRARPGDADLAVADTAKAMAIDPKNPSVLYTRGCSFLAAKAYESAAPAFERLRQTHPASPLGWYGAARLASARGDRSAAIENLRQARSRANALPGGWDSREVRRDPAFQFLQKDPQFAQIVNSD